MKSSAGRSAYVSGFFVRSQHRLCYVNVHPAANHLCVAADLAVSEDTDNSYCAVQATDVTVRTCRFVLSTTIYTLKL